MLRCLHCSGPVPKTNQKFCSMGCYRAYKTKVFVKHCIDCQRTPSQTKFNKHPATKDGLSSVCADCNAKRTRSRYEALSVDERTHVNRAKQKSPAKRNSTLLRKFGITLVEYESLLFNQEGRCKICKMPFKDNLVPRVDHDHSTGRVRGLLCNSCNLGLGQFRDDPGLLLVASRYLKSPPDSFVTSILFYEGEKRLDSRLMRKVKTSAEGRLRLLSLQGGSCAICKTQATGEASYHLDHSHVLGHVRGLLCSKCNHGLGALRDNPAYLEAAARYLREASFEAHHSSH